MIEKKKIWYIAAAVFFIAVSGAAYYSDCLHAEKNLSEYMNIYVCTAVFMISVFAVPCLKTQPIAALCTAVVSGIAAGIIYPEFIILFLPGILFLVSAEAAKSEKRQSRLSVRLSLAVNICAAVFCIVWLASGRCTKFFPSAVPDIGETVRRCFAFVFVFVFVLDFLKCFRHYGKEKTSSNQKKKTGNAGGEMMYTVYLVRAFNGLLSAFYIFFFSENMLCNVCYLSRLVLVCVLVAEEEPLFVEKKESLLKRFAR